MEAFRTAFRSALSTPLMADSAFRRGVVPGVVGPDVRPLADGIRIAGPAFTVEANNDLVSILLALHRAPAGAVLVIGNAVRGPAGLTGDIIATEARRKGIEAIAADGFIRDTAEIRRIGLPVFSRGRIPVGPLKLKPEQKGIGELGATVRLGEVSVSPGQWVLGDDDGLLVLDEADLPAVLAQAEETLRKEEDLVSRLRTGQALGDLFSIEAFVERRRHDPKADFNAHVAAQGDAI
ncbi:MAG: RraA family protein [Bacteroidetes bacterium]|nr:RraA family protein [Bacteroidota bacterium]MDA0873849.1 RraA family protein [Bacteroidota bacterium]